MDGSGRAPGDGHGGIWIYCNRTVDGGRADPEVWLWFDGGQCTFISYGAPVQQWQPIFVH